MGYRRSGHFVYKPDLLRSCCRLFTIRTTPDQVKLTKEYKSCVKKFKHFVQANTSVKPTTKKGNAPFDYIEELTQISNDTSNDFYTRYEPAVYTDEKYELYVKYQEIIHNDHNNNKKSFERFLCDSPFPEHIKMGTEDEWIQLNELGGKAVNSTNTMREPLKRLGPAHECYYYKDQLIAIAVTDFLPSGMSSVYFIWDPDFKKWSLGKLSVLRELTLLSKTDKPYYYLGYYVEDCHKMNYKAAYGGELLDICNSQYVSLDYLKKNGIIDHGHLFTFGKANAVEDEMDLDDRLDMRFPTLNVAETPELTNVAENIYGYKGSVAKNQEPLEETIETIRRYGVNYNYNDYIESLYVDKDTKVSHKKERPDPATLTILPTVVPGLVPVHEILDMLETERLSELDAKLLIFDTELQQIRPLFDFYNESDEVKTTVCNVVRLLGMLLAKRALVIV